MAESPSTSKSQHTMPRQPLNRDGFRIAIICALPLEFDAVFASFDETWTDTDYGKASGDPNRYATGRMGELPVVLLLLPGMGKSDAASAAASLRSSYENLSFAFVVGICGAIPYLTDDTEVILGDVIISKYIVRYDFGRQYPDELKPKRTIEDTLGRPNKETRILSALLETSYGRDKLEDKAQTLLRQLQEKTTKTNHRGKYDYVGASQDRLFKPEYRHKHYNVKECTICNACSNDVDPVCERALELKCADLACGDDNLITRARLRERQLSSQADDSKSPALAIHIGGVGSADTVMKSGKIRDKISRRDRIIAFEMEGAGVWDELPSCLVIKGVCDYADSHKPKGWQRYAAATAASTAKALLQGFFKDEQKKGQIANPLFSVPFAQNRDFVGRDDVLETLMGNLCAKDNSRIALFGMGGVGKTQVALHVAYLMQNNESEKNIIWLPAFSMASFEQACKDLTTKFGLPRSRDDDARVLVKQHLSSENVGDWLLILDNADSEEILYGSKDIPGIYAYLPSSESAQVLITSRQRKIAVDFAKTNVITITEMGEEEAESLLQASLLTKFSPSDDRIVSDLLRLLAYLPLAIVQAAAFINICEEPLDAYLQLCRRSEQEMMQLLRDRYEDDRLYEDNQKAVATTWLISFEQIRKKSPGAAKLLFFIMCIEPQAIPQSILPDIGSEADKIKAIGTLKSYGFLRARSERGIFDMHRLVHMVMQIWAKDQGIDAQRKKDALAYLAETFQSDTWEERMVWKAQLPHVLHAFRMYRKFDFESSSMLGYWAGRCLFEEGRYKEAVSLLEHVVRIEETTLAEDHPSRLASQHELATAYKSNGQIKEAIALLENVVKIKETTLAEDHPSRLASQYELATIYHSNGQTTEAIALLEHVVGIEETTLAEDHPSRLASQNELANAYNSNGQVTEAIALLEHVVKIQKTTLVEDHPSRLASQLELARAYKSNGQIREAIALRENVVKIQKTTLAEDHPSRLASQHELARAYNSNGQIKEAIALLEHVVKIQKTTLAEDHPSRIASQYDLAKAYRFSAQSNEAA